MIDKTKIFPVLMIVCYICASFICFTHGDVRRGTYWLAAAVLNVTITF